MFGLFDYPRNFNPNSNYFCCTGINIIILVRIFFKKAAVNSEFCCLPENCSNLDDCKKSENSSSLLPRLVMIESTLSEPLTLCLSTGRWNVISAPSHCSLLTHYTVKTLWQSRWTWKCSGFDTERVFAMLNFLSNTTDCCTLRSKSLSACTHFLRYH